MDPFMGQIQSFGFSFAPRGWAKCDGQLVPIAQNAALFSLLGTTYGGDGKTTFALPDLRGREPIGKGQGAGLAAYAIGQKGGQETHTLTENEMPAHQHAFTLNCNSTASDSKNPQNNVPGIAAGNVYAAAASQEVYMATMRSEASGGGQPFSIQDPYLVTNYCIALEGVYPNRS